MRIDVSVSEAKAANARTSSSSALAPRAPALPAPTASANVFAPAVAACNAALAVDETAGATLDAGVADLDRRTAQAINLYEAMNEQNREALDGNRFE